MLQVRELACSMLQNVVEASAHLRFRLLSHLAALLPRACCCGEHAEM